MQETLPDLTLQQTLFEENLPPPVEREAEPHQLLEAALGQRTLFALAYDQDVLF